MLENIVEKIIEKQVEKQKIDADDVSIYRYGYILMYEVILNLLIALIIGTFFGNLNMIFFFLSMYIPLRSFCGGWHANKVWKCTFISNMILLIELLGIEHVGNYFSTIDLLTVFFVCVCIIFIVAPVETATKRISYKEKKVYKKKIYLIVVLQVILMLVIIKFELEKFLFVMVYAYMIQIAMLLMEKAKIIIRSVKNEIVEKSVKM